MNRAAHRALWSVIFLAILTCGCGSDGPASPATDAEPAPDLTAVSDVKPDQSARSETKTQADSEVTEDAALDGSDPPSKCLGSYEEPAQAFKLPGTELLEISGLVASRQAPGALWGHNDSGAGPELLAFSSDGLLTRLTLSGTSASDWEDMARATCPDSDRDCLWVADIGNNLKNREVLSVIVVEEPVPGEAQELTREPQAIYTFSYPEDTMDAEALLVAPAGDRFYIIEKTNSDTARVFSSPTPLTTQSTMTLVELTTLQSPGEPVPYGKMITAADVHPSGSRIAVRCYTGTWEFRFPEGQGFEHLGEITPTYVALGPLEEVQGEAIAYSASGIDLYTASEDPNSLGNQPVHRYACEP